MTAMDKPGVDSVLRQAETQILSSRRMGTLPFVQAFFDENTNSVSYVVHDPQSLRALIIDSVLDLDLPSGRTMSVSADRIVRHVEERGLHVDWILETHAHADHLSAAQMLKDRLGGRTAIGRQIGQVDGCFSAILGLDSSAAASFDALFTDGEAFRLGEVPAMVLDVPGHTPADIAFVVGDALFTGDTLFMPDYGSARADFPGGDAAQLYRSARRILSLPSETRLFHCHDYKAPGRTEFGWETTVAAHRARNVHLSDEVTEESFVAMRTRRDATLAMPRLMLPALQVNLRGGRLPQEDAWGRSFLKIPLNAF